MKLDPTLIKNDHMVFFSTSIFVEVTRQLPLSYVRQKRSRDCKKEKGKYGGKKSYSVFKFTYFEMAYFKL